MLTNQDQTDRLTATPAISYIEVKKHSRNLVKQYAKKQQRQTD